jgi:hypothetical protein
VNGPVAGPAVQNSGVMDIANAGMYTYMDQIWTFNFVYTYGIRYVSFYGILFMASNVCVFLLCYMLYAICYMLYAICYMLYAICYMLYAICYMLYAICLYGLSYTNAASRQAKVDLELAFITAMARTATDMTGVCVCVCVCMCVCNTYNTPL